MGPTLFCTPATAEQIAGARAAAVLIGGYDGSGNYGDIAQLDAALDLLAVLCPGLLVLPLLERIHLTSHRELCPRALHPAEHPLFFDPGVGGEDDLVPVAAPLALAFGSVYLYGGGYLNRAWGDRKLAMLRAAEALLANGGAGRLFRIASGLQVEAGWLAGLDPEDSEALRRFDLLGVRDRDSAEALATLGSRAAMLETVDDAVGVLRSVVPTVARPPADRRLQVNVHFAEHSWVTERPEAMLRFYADFLGSLREATGTAVVIRPLIAYLDRRIDEQPGIGRLEEACAASGIEVLEALVLRPAEIAGASPELGRAALTVSSSYHLALTSLMLGVPAVSISDTPYYEQKVAGLREAFELPGEFSVSVGADPSRAAAAVAEILSGEESGARLRRGLADGASRLCSRRATVEQELLGGLGRATLLDLVARIEDLEGRLRERSAEPVDLLAKIGALESERERMRRVLAGAGLQLDAKAPSLMPQDGAGALGQAEAARAAAEERAVAAEERAAAAGRRAVAAETHSAATAETLHAVLASRSWKMAAPLRRARARLR